MSSNGVAGAPADYSGNHDGRAVALQLGEYFRVELAEAKGEPRHPEQHEQSAELSKRLTGERGLGRGAERQDRDDGERRAGYRADELRRGVGADRLIRARPFAVVREQHAGDEIGRRRKIKLRRHRGAEQRQQREGESKLHERCIDRHAIVHQSELRVALGVARAKAQDEQRPGR